jgi:hypothetical protein
MTRIFRTTLLLIFMVSWTSMAYAAMSSPAFSISRDYWAMSGGITNSTSFQGAAAVGRPAAVVSAASESWESVAAAGTLMQAALLQSTLALTVSAPPGSPTSQVAISFTVGGNGVASYRASLDGSSFDPPQVVSTPLVFTGLFSGVHTLRVVGCTSEEICQPENSALSLVWTIDAVMPTLVVSTLPDGSATNAPVLNIAGSVIDNHVLAGLTINNQAVDIQQDGSFSHAITLIAGSNAIETKAVDLAGNSISDVRHITLDQDLPSLFILTPADNSATASAQTTITGSCGDAVSVTVKVNNNQTPQAAVINSGSYTLTVNLSEGHNTLTVTATDVLGNSSSVARTIIYDNNSPTLAITDPKQDTAVSQATLTISGTVSDTLTETTVMVTFNDQIYAPVIENGIFSQQLTMPAQGTYTIIATATDAVGNSSSAIRNIIYAPVANNAGDLDNDGQVTVVDALRALQICIGFVSAHDDDLLRGDVAPFINGKPAPDGKLDVGDALLILRRAVDLVTW